ncbi:ABC transporter permease [Sphaerisporangium krabiense]|uniref:Sulfonate transport system permease protein n=1 Tax=Sphaerisporangium krabiense TaxID=763782 RepID=A0A7W8Z8J8_9ACTN|nr:ABC transporter permease [Sphaerisporangium krabiense]MBB5629270.1 sulfonate transport system permease protein [Sphaerisporangium krabiense]GII67043.1 ABC transporter permease [Sphaerisporangium krabiense]
MSSPALDVQAARAPGPAAGPSTVSVPPPRASRAPRRARAWRRWLSPLAVVVLWQIASGAGLLPERLLAAPSTVAATATDLIAEGVLPTAIAVSLQRVAIGFAAGAIAGVLLAVVAGLGRPGEYAVDPIMQMLRALPFFGLIPLFILWFGIGETPKVTLVALAVSFPLYLNTFAGIRGVDGKLAEVARTLKLGRAALLRHIVLPGALPQTLVGLRQSLGVAWLALIVAEQVNADAGLGFMINDAREFLRTDVIVVGLLVYSALGLLTDALVRLLERRALSWRRGFLAE